MSRSLPFHLSFEDIPEDIPLPTLDSYHRQGRITDATLGRVLQRHITALRGIHFVPGPDQQPEHLRPTGSAGPVQPDVASSSTAVSQFPSPPLRHAVPGHPIFPPSIVPYPTIPPFAPWPYSLYPWQPPHFPPYNPPMWNQTPVPPQPYPISFPTSVPVTTNILCGPCSYFSPATTGTYSNWPLCPFV